MTSEQAKIRRQYNAAMKARMLIECHESGAPVAKVAMSNDIDADVVRRWQQGARVEQRLVPARTGKFMPVPPVVPAVGSVSTSIRVERRHGAMAMAITGPAGGARELLR